jgi:signal transduction histidine kinase
MASEREATLLLVDDEPDSLEPMRLMLENNYRVLTALNGSQALDILEREAVDLLVADQRMPGMTGVELLARVREQRPDIVRLILTAYTDFDAMLQAINEGRVYRYIIKPWDVDDMRLTIRQALEWRELVLSRGQLAAELSEAHTALTERTRELERTQEALVRQEKLAAVGRFAAEMVHEMNNYLQIIMGVGADLVETRQSELQQVKQIGVQARLLADLAAEIRDFSLGAALPFSPEPTDPGELAAEVVRTCSHHPDFRGLQLRIESSEPGACMLDARQLKHLLLNLLKNAAKASPPNGEVLVAVRAEGDRLELRVVDHGSGVPPAVAERIWEPFFSTRGDEGTGLGLCICRQVAEAHGGRIQHQPTPGGGATFVAQIPMKQH